MRQLFIFQSPFRELKLYLSASISGRMRSINNSAPPDAIPCTSASASCVGTLDNSLRPDVTIAARLYPGNAEILDYYLLPGMDVLADRLGLAPNNGLTVDVYRFDNLNFFRRMAQRAALGEAA